jgi:hypothetical protein
MLAYAFDEHPLFRLAFPKAASRSMILQTFFTTVLEVSSGGRIASACSTHRRRHGDRNQFEPCRFRS